MSKFVDLVGQKFGRLVIAQRKENDRSGTVQWLCLCDCGNTKIVRGNDLKRGDIKSCGCLQKEKITARNIDRSKHGHTKNKKISATYYSWRTMIQRCTNPSATRYRDYGGRGITVCETWRNSFDNFLRDMGERPSKNQIDRIQNDKGYCKENCRWVTPKTNSGNRRDNRMETYVGRTQCRTFWAEEFNINVGTLIWRLDNGWSIKKAIETPISQTKKKEKNA